MREDAKRLENQPMGPASVNSNVGQLMVDVNSHYLDGTPNPYFGRPYLKTSEPYLRDKPWLWDTTRAQAVYKLDFSQDEGWSKWLGTQQVLGYYEYKDQQNRAYNYRHTATGLDKGWQQKYDDLNAPLGLQTNANVNPLYLSSTGGTDRPRQLCPRQRAILCRQHVGWRHRICPELFPGRRQSSVCLGTNSGAMIKDMSTIGWTPVPGGGLHSVNTVVKTLGGVLQSTFFDGKLVGTFGLRTDEVNDRNAPLALLTDDLREFNFEQANQWTNDWRTAEGKTQSFSVVARPFRDLRSLRAKVDGGSGVSKFFAELVSGLNLTYNQSDNFIAQGPAYDLFLNQLPNQTGESEDIGFWLTALDGKISLRYTHFDTLQLNLRNGDISTMAQRILRYEGFVANDRLEPAQPDHRLDERPRHRRHRQR